MIRALSIAAVVATPLAAQDIRECDWPSNAQNLVEPWEDYSRTFSNGKTRLALLDTAGEPAAGSFYLLILSPPYAELGERQCRVIGHNGMGFGYLDVPRLTATYDPSIGLVFEVPAEIFDGETYVEHTLTVILNQSTGEIGAEVSR